MTITVWPVDAVAGAPEYTGKLARQTMSAALAGATSARPLGTQSGVRFGTPTDTVSVSGSTVTIKPHAGVLDLQASAAASAYWYAIDANETETLDAAHSTHPRIDIITVKLDDPAESDGSSAPAVSVVYTAGTAAASPTTPTPATSRELVIATIAVPASGGGSAVASWTAPYAVAAGGIVPVRTTAERNALATAVTPTTHAPLYVHRIDADAGEELEYTIDGSTWHVIQAYDSGWTDLTTEAGFTETQPVQIRRIGMVVYLRGIVTPTTNWGAAGTESTVIAAAGIPADMRPASQYVATQGAVGTSVGHWFRVAPQTGGSLAVRNDTASSTSGVYLSGVTWPVG